MKRGNNLNEKEVAEIRRRFNPQKTNIIGVHGCYVNENREIVAEFNQPLAALTQDETESMLALLKKLLSGGLDRNLIDIEFSNEQVLAKRTRTQPSCSNTFCAAFSL